MVYLRSYLINARALDGARSLFVGIPSVLRPTFAPSPPWSPSPCQGEGEMIIFWGTPPDPRQGEGRAPLPALSLFMRRLLDSIRPLSVTRSPSLRQNDGAGSVGVQSGAETARYVLSWTQGREECPA